MTFPSHATAVLPIKLAAPRRWDGVALVIGSAAPDLPYACAPYLRLNAHTLPALVWFCVPATLVGAWLIRRCAPEVAAHLPPLRHFAVRDYQVIGLVRHRWQVTLVSACVGALTHLLWDSFTHPRSVQIWTFLPLDRIAVAGQPWWHVLQVASTLLGACVAVGLFWHIGRHRLLVAWHGVPQPIAARHSVFWPVAVVVAVAGCVAVLTLAGSRHTYILGVRLLAIAAAALLAGAAATRLARPRLLP